MRRVSRSASVMVGGWFCFGVLRVMGEVSFMGFGSGMRLPSLRKVSLEDG